MQWDLNCSSNNGIGYYVCCFFYYRQKIKKKQWSQSQQLMDSPPAFTWYDLWKDYMSGDLSNVMEKTIDMFQVPDECFAVTTTVTLGIFICLCVLARIYSSITLSIIHYLLGVSDDDKKSSAPLTTVIVNMEETEGRRRRSRTRSPGSSESIEEQLRRERARRTKDITDEYKKFAPAVLNILGKNIMYPDKIQEIMSKVEDLSIEAIIGYNWEKKVSKNIATLVERYYPDDFEQGVLEIG